MNDMDLENVIDDEQLIEIQEVFSDDHFLDIVRDVSTFLEFGLHIAPGFRFRYQSEIDKKSFSGIKGEKNQSPTIKVLSSFEGILKLDLVTETSSSDTAYPHFNTLYEVSKLKGCAKIVDGICFIQIKQNQSVEIKLDFLGIRKWKLKEAIPRIQEKYPQLNDTEAKQFFNKNKDTVKLRALLFDAEYIASSIISHTIKSQIAKENKAIKIQHISPKTVADYKESLIIILEKKITSECTTFLILDNVSTKIKLDPAQDDGQTLVFNLPPIMSQSPMTGRIRVECSEYYDEVPISFHPVSEENRKRKNIRSEMDIPLKKSIHDDSPRQLYPESGNLEQDIEYDGPCSMETDESNLPDSNNYPTSCSESCKDSGIYSGDKSSTTGRTDDDEDSYNSDDEDYDDSGHENDEDSDIIEIEGVRRRRVHRQENLEPINFPPPKRSIDSRLTPLTRDKVTNKILKEIARIGHDFAFGKTPEDLFKRIEKQLPVVFTLQDDVGDTPLNNAILKGNTAQADRILKLVHDECSWALDLTNTSGHTALILAPACDVPGTFIQQLLDDGCRLDLRDDLGKSAITYAIEYKNTPALIVFLQHIQKNHMGQILQRYEKNYFTDLQIAVMNCYNEGVKLLLDLKNDNDTYVVDVNELALMNGDNALHIAVERNVGLDIVRSLLERPDIDINHKRNSGSTVLYTAMKMHLTDVEMLLKSYSAQSLNDGSEPEENMVSADEEAEDDEDLIHRDICPVVEMTPEQVSQPTSYIIHLSESLEQMSLNGDNQKQLIDIMLKGVVFLRVHELKEIVRPAYWTLISHYGNTEQDRLDIANILDRFNCLPNSIGQVFERLKLLNRLDMIEKVVNQFH